MVLIASTADAAQAKPILHIECCCTYTGVKISRSILVKDIDNWLRRNFVSVELKQTFTSFPGLSYSQYVEFLTIADITSSIETPPIVLLAHVDIGVDVFQLHTDADEPLQAVDAAHSAGSDASAKDEEGVTSQATITCLPSRSLHGVWESLIFEDPLHFRLLRFSLRMISFASHCASSKAISWNRILLLHGPSGTGKTTLCRALAQQLSKRLSQQYPTCKLVEFDAHSLFSKFFSESGKLVSTLFRKIETMLDQDNGTFVCVFIDEIESLANTRQYSASSNEPRDSLRAVNALLIALDRLRNRPNLLILCTSNLIKAMDPAFLDRVDVKQLIPEPCLQARYEIYRTTYLELSRCGIIAPVHHCPEDDHCLPNSAMECESPNTLLDGRGSPVIDDTILPAHNLTPMYLGIRKDSVPQRLWDIAEKSENLSGRTLRRLPTLALALYTRRDPCSMDEAIDALSRAVDEEKLVKGLLD